MTIGLTNEQLVVKAPAIGATHPHHTASERYSFVPTLTAVNLLRDLGWTPVEARQSRTRGDKEGFQKHMIRFMMGDLDLGQERCDLCLVNGHALDAAFNLLASIWRKACGNGLMVSSELASFSHRHVNFSPDKFVDSAQLIAGQTGEIASRVGEFKMIELSPEESAAFAASAIDIAWDEGKAPLKPETLLTRRRFDDTKDTLWNTYNVVQENIVKGGLKDNFKKGSRKTRGVKSIDGDIRLNKALWTLTEKMAELKQAA